MTAKEKKEIAELMACRLKGHKIILAGTGPYTVEKSFCLTCLLSDTPIFPGPKISISNRRRANYKLYRL